MQLQKSPANTRKSPAAALEAPAPKRHDQPYSVHLTPELSQFWQNIDTHKERRWPETTRY
jgi:hypothetical protein